MAQASEYQTSAMDEAVRILRTLKGREAADSIIAMASKGAKHLKQDDSVLERMKSADQIVAHLTWLADLGRELDYQEKTEAHQAREAEAAPAKDARRREIGRLEAEIRRLGPKYWNPDCQDDPEVRAVHDGFKALDGDAQAVAAYDKPSFMREEAGQEGG